MNSINDTINALRKASRKVIEKSADCDRILDTDGKVHWLKVKKYLDKEISQFENISVDYAVPKTVFISYSKNSGEEMYNFLSRRLSEKGFTVLDGFMKAENNKGLILKNIKKNLQRSTVYIGILTKDMQIKTGKGKDDFKWSPSVWVMEEKGMALMLNKPFFLIIDNEIHEDFWKKTTPEKKHFIFDSNYHFYNEVSEIAVEEALERYAEKLLKFLQK